MIISTSFRTALATISMAGVLLATTAPVAFADTASSTASTTPPTAEHSEASSTPTMSVSTSETATTTSSGTTSTSTSMTLATSSPDTVRPTGMFASNAPMKTGDNPIPFSVTFSEPVMGLISSFFNIGNGSVTNFNAISSSYYTFDVVPAAPTGSVSVDLNGDRVTDLAGNYNIALPQIQRIIDSTLPNNYAFDSGTGTSTGTTTATSTGMGGSGGTGGTATSTATTSMVFITGGPANGSSTASTSVAFTFNAPTSAIVTCMFGSVTTTYECDSPQKFNGLPEGTYTFTVIATDSHHATSSDMRTFTIDRTAPITSEVSPIASSTSATPTYKFTSNEAGTITYGGSCSSATTNAVSGVNTITLNSLANGDYANCTITVIDAAGNGSAPLTLTPFTITAPVVLQASGSAGSGGGTSGGRSGGGSGNRIISGGNSGETTTTVGGGSGDSNTGTNTAASTAVGTGSTGTSGDGSDGVNRLTDGGTVALGGDATVTNTIDTGSSTVNIASTSSTTEPTGIDGSQAAAVGLARVPAILWGLLLLLIIAIIGGTIYYRRETAR
jgi:hypothetical protein